MYSRVVARWRRQLVDSTKSPTAARLLAFAPSGPGLAVVDTPGLGWRNGPLVRRFSTLQAIMRTRFEVKMSKVKVSRLIKLLKPNVCRLRTSSLVGGWSMRYQRPQPAKRPMKLGYCTRAGAYRVGRTRRPYNLLWLRYCYRGVSAERIYKTITWMSE